MVLKVVNAETGGVLMRTSDVEIAVKEARRMADRLRPALIQIRSGAVEIDSDEDVVLDTVQVAH